MRNRKQKASVLLALALVAGGASAAVAQQGSNRPKPPKAPQRPLPPEAIAEREAWRRTGTIPPLPYHDPTTGDLARNPDGSLKLIDLEKVPPPPTLPCATSLEGCNPGLRRG